MTRSRWTQREIRAVRLKG